MAWLDFDLCDLMWIYQECLQGVSSSSSSLLELQDGFWCSKVKGHADLIMTKTSLSSLMRSNADFYIQLCVETHVDLMQLDWFMEAWNHWALIQVCTLSQYAANFDILTVSSGSAAPSSQSLWCHWTKDVLERRSSSGWEELDCGGFYFTASKVSGCFTSH